MSRGTAMEQTAKRVDRLVRSLVGVDDLRPSWDAGGRLCALHVLRNTRISDHQLARNVVSGLQAALGMKVDTTAIRIYSEPAVFTTSIAALGPAILATPAADVSVAPAVAEPPAGAVASANPNGSNGATPAGSIATNGHAAPPAPQNGRTAASAATNGSSGNGRVHPPSNNGSPLRPGAAHPSRSAGNGSSRVTGAGVNGAASSKPAAPAAAPGHACAAHVADPPTLRLERLSMDRQGVMLRCRVVLALDEHRYSAIAEAPAGATAEVELAARVTLDALRAGALTCAHLEGVGFSRISELTYVVAAIRGSGSDTPRAAAAPLTESAARAAAEAVLNVVGPITAVQRKAAERRLGKL